MNTIEIVNSAPNEMPVFSSIEFERGNTVDPLLSIKEFVGARTYNLKTSDVTLVAGDFDESFEITEDINFVLQNCKIPSRFETNLLVSPRNLDNLDKRLTIEDLCKVDPNSSIDSGPSHIGTASQMAKFLISKIDQFDENKKEYVIAVSNRGNIEFLQYSLISIVENGKFDTFSPLSYFNRFNGEIPLLRGLKFCVTGEFITMYYPSENSYRRKKVSIPISIIKELSELPKSPSFTRG